MAFPQTLFPYGSLHSTRLRPLGARAADDPAEALGEAQEDGLNPWSVIWSVGGACWFIVTCTALLWMLPMSGRQIGDVYSISTGARAVQHLMIFMVAALGYRVAIAIGWPAGRWAQVRVVLVNCAMALVVMI